jgi:hypothetical protein
MELTEWPKACSIPLKKLLFLVPLVTHVSLVLTFFAHSMSFLPVKKVLGDPLMMVNR